MGRAGGRYLLPGGAGVNCCFIVMDEIEGFATLAVSTYVLNTKMFVGLPPPRLIGPQLALFLPHGRPTNHGVQGCSSHVADADDGESTWLFSRWGIIIILGGGFREL